TGLRFTGGFGGGGGRGDYGCPGCGYQRHAGAPHLAPRAGFPSRLFVIGVRGPAPLPQQPPFLPPFVSAAPLPPLTRPLSRSYQPPLPPVRSWSQLRARGVCYRRRHISISERPLRVARGAGTRGGRRAACSGWSSVPRSRVELLHRAPI